MKNWYNLMRTHSTTNLIDRVFILADKISNEPVYIFKNNKDYTYELAFKKWALISIIVNRTLKAKEKEKLFYLHLNWTTCPICIINSDFDNCSRCVLAKSLDKYCDQISSDYRNVRNFIKCHRIYKSSPEVRYSAQRIRNHLYALAYNEIHHTNYTWWCDSAAKINKLPFR